jgi:hypothetical protein
MLTFFFIVISTFAIAADGCIGWNAYWQYRALGYGTTTGVITRSAVEVHQESHNKDWISANIRYDYSVSGAACSGDRYRYGGGFATEGIECRIVRENPVGKHVTVYYNPANPADSLLHPGVEGFDLFLALCLLPFSLFPLGIFVAAVRRTWGRCFGYGMAGAKLWDDGFVVRLRLPPAPAMFSAAAAAGVLACIAIFPIAFYYAFYYGGLQPPKWLMYRVWPAVLAGAAMAYVAAKWKQGRGGYDLVIDTTAKTVSLPRTTQRKLNLVMPLHELTAVEVRTVGLPGSRGGIFAGHYATAVFTDANGISRAERLAQWGDPRRAETLAAWLRQRLKLPAPAAG